MDELLLSGSGAGSPTNQIVPAAESGISVSDQSGPIRAGRK